MLTQSHPLLPPISSTAVRRKWEAMAVTTNSKKANLFAKRKGRVQPKDGRGKDFHFRKFLAYYPSGAESLLNTSSSPLLLSAIRCKDGGATFTVDDALGAMGFGKFQALALVYSGIGYAAEAMETMILSFIGTAVQAEWNLSSGQEGLITSVVFAGELLGAYAWGIVSDNYGRSVGQTDTAIHQNPDTRILLYMKGFLFTALFTAGAGFLSAFAPNYISLMILRFVVGIGLGGGPVLLSWFLEFVPTPNRGTWMFVFSCFWTIGSVLEASLAWAVMPRFGWRWLLALSAIPSFLLLLFYGVVPESPRYLCLNGRTDDAMLILENIARVNHKPLPCGTLVSERKEELREKLNPSEDAHLIPELNHITSNEDAESKIGGIRVLYWILSPTLIRTTLLLWMDFFGNAFAYYGVVLLTTELVSEKKCSVMLHSNQMVDTSPYEDVFITSFAEFPGLLLSAVIVDRVGRKLSMLVMLSLGGIFLIPLLFQQTEVVTTALLFGARSCITGSINTLYIYAPEISLITVSTRGFCGSHKQKVKGNNGHVDFVGRMGITKPGVLKPRLRHYHLARNLLPAVHFHLQVKIRHRKRSIVFANV